MYMYMHMCTDTHTHTQTHTQTHTHKTGKGLAGKAWLDGNHPRILFANDRLLEHGLEESERGIENLFLACTHGCQTTAGDLRS